MTRIRIVVAVAVGAGLFGGIASQALADDPYKVCVQFPKDNPTDPRAPGYCVYPPLPR